MAKRFQRVICAAGVGGLIALPALAEPVPRFPAEAVWYQDISQATPHGDSEAMIDKLSELGGWGLGRMQIDFSQRIVHADAGAPMRTLVGYPFDDYYSPDCEPIGTAFPLPAHATIEGSNDLTCDNESEDCHLQIVQGTKLYELYHANASGTTGMEAQCIVIWDLSVVYPPQGRGDQCTSADAAGFPMAPLLWNADEVFAAMQVPNGDLGHALRFVLPNERIATDAALGGLLGRLYVRPASHAGFPQGPIDTVPYGARLRLRSDFPLAGYGPGAQAVLRTMMRYGIVLADGGSIALNAESDLYTTHTWSEVGIAPQTFNPAPGSGRVKVNVDDFTVIDTGARMPENFNCVRSTIPTGVLFANGFEG